MNELSRLLLTQQPIPFMQLLTYNSTVLADNPDLKPGSFYISKGEIDLGPEFEAIPVAVRSYAYVRKGNALLFDTFDTMSNHFLQAVSLEKNKKKGWQSKWGGMVLLYLPKENLFVTYFLAGPGGGRNCLEQVLPNMQKLIMFSSNPRKSNAGHRWWAPTILANSAAETPPLPDTALEVIQQFNDRQGREAEEEDDR